MPTSSVFESKIFVSVGLFDLIGLPCRVKDNTPRLKESEAWRTWVESPDLAAPLQSTPPE